MRKNVLVILSFFLLGLTVSEAQVTDFAGYRIFINPGHGGNDSDDRHMPLTDFWESEGNLVKGLYLRELLQNMKATVYMSRTSNTTADDLPLSSISAMANSAGADFFLSIHSNGYDGSENRPLVLFRGYDYQPVFPDAKIMAGIMWQKLFEKGNCWTNSTPYVKGDWTFYPAWGTQGLGVLRNLTMPGVLSEGSFHDYIPEGWRLRNTDYLHHESWAFVRSFIEYRNVLPLSHGVIAGTVRDAAKSPEYYFSQWTKDSAVPLNGAKVTLKPGNRVYTTDNFNNGFFMFDSVSPGNYMLKVEGIKDFLKDSVEINVSANKTLLADIYPKHDTAIAPVVLMIYPPVTDSVPVRQEFLFSFSLPMNRDSVQKALLFSPLVQLQYEWYNDYSMLSVKPVRGYSPKTTYTVSLSSTACSKWNVKITAPVQFNFISRYRAGLKLEMSFPGSGQNQVSLFPQIFLKFDAMPDLALLVQNISVLDEDSKPVPLFHRECFEKEGKGYFKCEISEPLSPDKKYRTIINKDLADFTGSKIGTTIEIPFTTRKNPYPSGTSVEPFEEIGRFWDPEVSGSTIGTDNPATTFTSSADILKSGNSSGRLNYSFVNQSGGVCRVFDTQKPVIGQDGSKLFGIWVFGDLSYNILEYWFYSSGSTNQIVQVDTIDWAGWELKIIPLNIIGGSGDLSFHSVVVRQTAIGSKSGTIWFDDAQLISPTGIIDHRIDKNLIILSYPNPFNSINTLRIISDEEKIFNIDVFSLAGEKISHIAGGGLQPGEYSFTWSPSPSVADGIYFYRIELRDYRNGKTVVITKKCVLIR